MAIAGTKAGNSLKFDNAGVKMTLFKDEINDLYYIGTTTLEKTIELFGNNYKIDGNFKIWINYRSHISYYGDKVLICTTKQFETLRYLFERDEVPELAFSKYSNYDNTSDITEF